MMQKVVNTVFKEYRIATSNGYIVILREADLLIAVTYPDGKQRDLTYEEVIQDRLTILDNDDVINFRFSYEVAKMRRSFGVKILGQYAKAKSSDEHQFALASRGVGYLILEDSGWGKHQPELHFNDSDDVMQWELTLTNDEEIILGVARWNDEQAITDLCSILLDPESCFTMYALLDPNGARALTEQEGASPA
jgi:hypothetical protein